ncbi:MAG TPA: protein kinase [Jatrophihabitans sp.]|nr:protein kinase [Jatrophihabitans sp.]
MALLRRADRGGNEFFPGFTGIAEIGVGSLATVFRAREVATDRQVALKLLNVRDASAEAIESFERESIALGALSSHPNIVTLYRSFRVADGRPVLVLELCRAAVSDRMRDGAGVPVAEAVAIGIKIAGALETAHRAQILHRDVKPQNILVTEYGEPALADFGVAMLQSATQTTAGLFDFTTLHAAPELLEGGETSPATDVYELASTLYQLIAGRSAFRAHDGESPASVILRILRDPVRPLVNAQVPAQLSDVLVRAMSKDKDDRPPTAAEFAAQLAAVEQAQGWRRTQFLIREPNGPVDGAPVITRVPEPSTRPLPVSRPALAPEAAEPDPVSRPAPKPVRFAVRIDEFEFYGDPVGDELPAASQPAPLPSSDGLPPEPRRPRPTPTPTAVHRPTPNPAAPARPLQPVRAGGAVDPLSLRRRATIRSGAATLTVDEARLALRSWWRRSELLWPEVIGFEQRSGSGRNGRLVARTRSGWVELPATRRPHTELADLQALLEAYHTRAQLDAAR